MFKAAKAGPAKVITANRLADGVVVFLDPAQGWSADIAGALVLADGPELDQALAFGMRQQAGRVIIDPYAVDVTVGDDGPVPVRLRERIRAERGPTVAFGPAERARLSAAS